MGVKRTEGVTKKEESYHPLHLLYQNNTLPVLYLPWDKTQNFATNRFHAIRILKNLHKKAFPGLFTRL